MPATVAIGAWAVSAAVAAALASPGGVVVATAIGLVAHIGGSQRLLADRRVRRRALSASSVTTMAATLLLIAVVASGRAMAEHAALDRVESGMFRGWVTLVGPPVGGAGGTRQIISLDGRRFEVRLRPELAAESVVSRRWMILGETRLIDGDAGRRRQMRHVVGRVVVHRLIATDPGTRLDRWRLGTRRLIRAGADRLDEDRRSLFLGLVIGDRDQPDRRVTDRFRDSGLAHLNVASGLNVTLLLVTAAPILVRLRPIARWALTVAIVAWFADLVGAEPSIIRASMMAVIAASAYLGGLRWRTIDVLLLATAVLVVIDPFLVHLAGFWMSVGATAGVVALGPPIARRMARHPGRPGRLASALSVTLGAQAGVGLPLMMTIGAVPLVSLPANLLAVPLGSVVKAYGLPAAVVAGVFPSIGGLVMAPIGPAVAVIDRIAAVSADLEPDPPWSLVGWIAVAVALVVGRRSRSTHTA